MTVIDTRLGKVRGVPRSQTTTFFGLPFAAPPVGPLRWRPPSPATRWSGVFDATRPGNRSWQLAPPSTLANDDRVPSLGEMSEDMLYLNVYTPGPGGPPRPVVIYIHGGGYTVGSANEFDPTPFARRHDVVFVSINYRLGIFGFLDLSSLGAEFAGSGSLGFQDQIAALQWIRDNIADYGGDPDNVTVTGVSAGAGSVLALMAAPAALGLFHRAVAFSPPVFAARPSPLMQRWSAVLNTTPEALYDKIRGLSGKALFEFGVERGLTGSAGADGEVIVHVPEAAIRAGVNNVPLVIGTCINEGTLMVPSIEEYELPGLEVALADIAADIGGGDAERYHRFLRESLPGASERERMVRFWYDNFRAPVVRAAQAMHAAGAPAWVYSFEVPTDHPFGPTHASDMAFSYNLLDPEPGEPAVSVFHPDTPQNRRLSRIWTDAFARFARTGDPNGGELSGWPTYDPVAAPTMVLREKPEVFERYDSDAALRAYGLTPKTQVPAPAN